MTGSAFADSLAGGVGNDALTGGSGADILVSNAGNDTLTGGSGADTMLGGDGSDRYVIELAEDHLGDTIEDIGAGVDELRFTSATASTLTLLSSLVGIESVVIGTGTGATAVATATTALNVDASLVTNALSITGNAGANRLMGGSGIDTLIGGSGNDTLIGGLGNDNLTGGIGIDTFTVASGTDTITDLSGTGTNADILTVGVGAVAIATVTAAWTATAATSNAGTVNITTGGFAVNLASALGPNGYTVTNIGTAAAIVGSAFADSLIGGNGNDTLTGGAGADSMTGGVGNDTLRGDAGSDVLVGGLGNDNLTGGIGSDSFVLNATLGTTNIDTILDFVHLTDKIQLENLIFTQLSVAGTLNAANFSTGAAADANDYILYNTASGRLYYDSDGNGAGVATQIALIGTFTHAGLTAADFTVI